MSKIQKREVQNPKLAKLLRQAASLADQREWKLYLVGGYLRDLLLGRPNDDVDVSVEGDAIALASALQAGGEARLDTAGRFGTAHLTLGGDVPGIDLVTARRESYAAPGALPTVEPGDINDDLARRDFTVNALAAPILPEGLGPVLDPHGGLRDVRDGIIRVLHPNSFIDDPTRIPRAVKYSARLGFKIEPQTLELILLAVRDGAISTVSTDRMVRELLLIMEEQEAATMLARLEDLGVLRAIHPDLTWPYSKGSATSATLAEGLTPPQRRDANLAILGAEYAGQPAEAEAFARAIGLDAHQVRLMRDSAALTGTWPRLGEPGLRPSQVYNLLKGLDVNTLQAFTRISALAGDHAAWANLHAYLDTIRHVKPQIDGTYLKELGIEPGPIYSRILSALLEAKMDGRLPERDDEERFVRDLLEKERGGDKF